MHQNEPVKASAMLPSFHPSSSSLPFFLLLLIWFLLSPPLLSGDCCRCLSPLTFTPHLLRVRNVCVNPIQIISRRERATTRRCQWQFHPPRASGLECGACSRKLSDCIWICADLLAAQRKEKITCRRITRLSPVFLLPLSFNDCFQRVLRDRWRFSKLLWPLLEGNRERRASKVQPRFRVSDRQEV